MNSFSIPGPHLHGHHGRQSAKATGLPRQSLSSHLARWRWGNKNRKKQREAEGEKKRELYTQIRKMDTWRNLCTNACAQYVGWSRELFARAVTVGNRREVEQEQEQRRNGGRGQLANKAKPQRQRLTAAKWHTAVFQRKTKLKPNRTKPKRCETKRNATKTNMFFN